MNDLIKRQELSDVDRLECLFEGTRHIHNVFAEIIGLSQGREFANRFIKDDANNVIESLFSILKPPKELIENYKQINYWIKNVKYEDEDHKDN